MKGLGSGKNIWTGKKVTLQDQALVDSVLEKTVLGKIMCKKMHPGEKEFRYHWCSHFIDHLNIMGEIISKNPGLQKYILLKKLMKKRIGYVGAVGKISMNSIA